MDPLHRRRQRQRQLPRRVRSKRVRAAAPGLARRLRRLRRPAARLLLPPGLRAGAHEVFLKHMRQHTGLRCPGPGRLQRLQLPAAWAARQGAAVVQQCAAACRALAQGCENRALHSTQTGEQARRQPRTRQSKRLP